MQIGSVALILLAMVQVQTSILQGAGKIYIVTFNLILGIIGKIISNYFLIANKNINIKGAIIGSVICYSIPIILNFHVMKNVLKIRLGIGKLLYKPVSCLLHDGYNSFCSI